MFNDLNQTNNQANPPVDDIFAETEQSAGQKTATQSVASGIETRRIGLAAGDGETEPIEEPSSPWFKVVVISIVVIILALGGYLVYSKFMTPQDVNIVDLNQGPVSTSPVVNNEVPSETSAEVVPVVEEEEVLVEEVATEEEIIPLIPGVNSPVEEPITPPLEIEPVTPAQPVDTDQDGLTDLEENAAGTNINIVDTDGDGLSDYEELKIYGTNPLLADTDGDNYSDGDEVKNGYNPLGDGKLQGNQ